jgi:hypothetical protein
VPGGIGRAGRPYLLTAVGLWMAAVSGLEPHLSTAGAVSGSQASHDIPFDFATLRTLKFAHPRLGLSRAQSGSSSRSERDGIIGNDLLRAYVVTVDYRRRVLFLEHLAP